jgi:hypothetical protein
MHRNTNSEGYREKCCAHAAHTSGTKPLSAGTQNRYSSARTTPENRVRSKMARVVKTASHSASRCPAAPRGGGGPHPPTVKWRHGINAGHGHNRGSHGRCLPACSPAGRGHGRRLPAWAPAGGGMAPGTDVSCEEMSTPQATVVDWRRGEGEHGVRISAFTFPSQGGCAAPPFVMVSCCS